jgi:hypothetical protein
LERGGGFAKEFPGPGTSEEALSHFTIFNIFNTFTTSTTCITCTTFTIPSFALRLGHQLRCYHPRLVLLYVPLRMASTQAKPMSEKRRLKLEKFVLSQFGPRRLSESHARMSEDRSFNGREGLIH